MSRRRFFRGVRVLLECGHVKTLPSSYWRLTPDLVATLFQHAFRGGTWCHLCPHGGMAMPTEILGTCRIEEAR
jgi:hypothetical protein